MGADPYEPRILIDNSSYFPAPYTNTDLKPSLRSGLIALGLLATLSVVSTLILIGFIAHRFISWRRHYKTFVGYNQYVVLVLNLLLAGKHPLDPRKNLHSRKQISARAPRSC